MNSLASNQKHSYGRWRQWVVVIACLYSALLARAQVESPALAADPAATIITTFDEYWRAGLRGRVRPIRAELVVTYYDPAWGHLWGEIDGRAGYMRSASHLPLQAFDRVLIAGTVVPDTGVSTATATIAVLESNVAVVPASATGRLAEFNTWRSHLVTCDVIVGEEQFSDGNHLIVDGVAEGYRVHVYQWMEPPQLRGLHPGDTVRVTGVYNANRNADTSMLEIDLWVGRPGNVVLAGAGAPEAGDVAGGEFAGPLISTIEDFWAEPLRDTRRRIRAELLVTYYDPVWGNLWGEIAGQPGYFRGAPRLPLRSRDRVVIEGSVVPNAGLTADAITITKLARDVPVTPVSGDGKMAMPDQLRSRLVTCEVVVDGESANEDHHLVIDGTSEGQAVRVLHWEEQPRALGLAAGSRVRVTGVYNENRDPQTGALRIDLWVARTQDIVALDRAKVEAAVPDPSGAAIRSFADFYQDGRRDVARPIAIEMTVVYYDPPWFLLWGKIDGIDGYMPCRLGTGVPMRSRDRVRIEGTVIPNEGLMPDRVTVSVLERNVPLSATLVQGDLADATRHAQRLVTTEVVVDQRVAHGQNNHGFEGMAEGLRVHAFHWSETDQPLALPEGAIVRVTALYNAKRDPRTGATQIDLWIARPEDVTVIDNLATDARFALSVSPIGSLVGSDNDQPAPAHIVGVVREYTVGRDLVLRDDTGQIVVRTVQILPLKIGDVVEAWGRPFTLSADSVLLGGLIRPASTQAANEVLLRISAAKELRLADQVLALQPDEAAEGRPVELKGVVVWASEKSRTIVVRDGTGGVRVDLSGVVVDEPKVDYVLKIWGSTVAGAFAPGVRATKVSFESSALPPEARALTLDQVKSGLEEGESVDIRGLVQDVRHDGQRSRLTLSTSTGEFTALLEGNDDLAPLLGSMVSVRGVCQAVANASRQLTGIEIWCNRASDLRVEQEAPADPFTVPLRRINALRQFNSRSTLQFWARVRGVVTHQVEGRLIFVQDGAEGLLILSSQNETLHPGDVIEATGLPGLESNRVVLREAVFRRVGQGAEPAPVELTSHRDLDETLESRLVHVAGVLINTVTEGGSVHLAVQADERIFNAVLGRADTAVAPLDWLAGSQVELTGVYELVRDERRQPDSFRLQLRTAADVTVLRRPSWWTPQRAVLVIIGLCACVTGGLVWGATLRRRVREQTVQIRGQVAKEAKLEARHRDVFEKASDFIFTTDRDGRFTTFNPAGERITGYTRDAALALNLHDLIEASGPDDEFFAALRTPQDQALTFQRRLKTSSGRVIWAEASARFVFEGGEFTGLLGVIRDISERKQVEDELKRARDAAEANTQAKSAFLANMSHEIRTPMNGVIGMSNLLLDTALHGEQREFATTIRNSAESLMTVINDILDFSKIEAGKLQFDIVEFDLVHILEEAIELMAERAAARHLELVAILPADLPARLCGDPGRIRQVLLNLLGNAVKFTETGEITVGVSHERDSGDAIGLRVAVMDTGIGISAAAQRNLFRPFVQADASTTRRFGGTGLGLVISKQIVDLMGGEIGVESAPARGSTFWFTLPLQKSRAEGTTTALPPAAYGAAPRRALVVDGHADGCAALVACATACGLVTAAAASARQAQELIADAASSGAPYDVVLFDSRLASPEGLEFARALRRPRESAAGPALILVRPFDRAYSTVELADAGAAAVVRRPVRRRELMAALDRLAVPAVHSDGPATRADEAPALPANQAVASRLRILIAEDNVVNQRLIVLQLRKLGYTADVAVNGVDVLEALTRAEYDLVLMDCQMPEMDGYEATRRIRQNVRTARVRIVAMTANAMQGDREKCIAAGMDDYVSKPVRVEALAAAMHAAAGLCSYAVPAPGV